MDLYFSFRLREKHFKGTAVGGAARTGGRACGSISRLLFAKACCADMKEIDS
jgi:hypothetical protein